MAKYIKCYCCGKRIPFGEFAYHFEYDSVYCSETCYCSATAQGGIVNEDFAYSCDCIVYDDEARREEIRKEIEQTKIDISNLQMKLRGLEFDLQSYE